jgi:ATP-binding cassette subfamily B protein
MPQEDVPTRCGYVAQIPRPLSTTLADNITLGRPGDIGTALQQAVLDEDVARFGEGVQTLVGPRGLRLSGGQRLRLAAARALIHHPDLLVLDDVSSALDNPTESELWSRLEASPGLTALIVSNRPQVIAAADEVVVSHRGEIVAQGRPQALMKDSRELKALLRRVDGWAR